MRYTNLNATVPHALALYPLRVSCCTLSSMLQQHVQFLKAFALKEGLCLQALDIVGCMFTGTLPEEYSYMFRIRELSLAGNS